MTSVELEGSSVHLGCLRPPAGLVKEGAVVVQEVRISRLQLERVLMVFAGHVEVLRAAVAVLAAQLRVGLGEVRRQFDRLLQQANGILMISSFAN